MVLEEFESLVGLAAVGPLLDSVAAATTAELKAYHAATQEPVASHLVAVGLVSSYAANLRASCVIDMQGVSAVEASELPLPSPASPMPLLIGKTDDAESSVCSPSYIPLSDEIVIQMEPYYVDGAMMSIDDSEPTTPARFGLELERYSSSIWSYFAVDTRESFSSRVMRSFSIYSIKSLLFDQRRPPALKDEEYTQKKFDIACTEEYRAIRGLIIDMCYALSIYGVSSYRLEHQALTVASFYGVALQIAATPTVVWLSFGPLDDVDSKSTVIRIQSTMTNLEKLVLVDEIATKIAHGKIQEPYEARDMLAKIIAKRDIYSNFFVYLFSHILAPVGSGINLNATWLELIACLAAGIINAVWYQLCGKFTLLGRLRNICCAVFGGLCGLVINVLFYHLTPGVRCMPFLVAIAAVYHPLPGLSLTISIAELATRNLNAGLSRLAAALIVVMQLCLGVLLVGKLAAWWFGVSDINTSLASNVYPNYVRVVGPIFIAMALVIDQKVPPHAGSVFFIILTCVLAWLIVSYASLLDPALGSLLASFAVTCIANVYSRLKKHPAIVVSGVAMILLVPGSTSLRAVAALFLDQDPVQGLYYVLRLVETIGPLVVGMFAGEYVFPVRWRIQL